ncbi:MAG: alkaline phosphatase family protein [Turneriella sp.]|nr:alkaline phosphatase family protein [Turneriella sp.]
MPRFFPVFLIAATALSFFSAFRTGENVFVFPYHADFEIHNSDPGPDEGLLRDKIAKRIFLVVVDGLAERSVAAMPQLSELKKKAAYFTAEAPFPSLSRPGYTTILTGSPPAITGIGSNVPEVMDARIDNLARRLRSAGWKTAFVGLSWWMDFFDADFDIARIDSGYDADAPIFKDGVTVEPGLGKKREVLWHGKYQETPDGWRQFIQRYKISEYFGDNPFTAESEDAIRTREALRIWKKNDPDFMLLHLQMPDHAGHNHGGTANPAYQHAIAETDQNIARIVDAVSFRDTALVITADHGFTDSVEHAGHGGHEASAREIPLFIAGPSVKRGYHGRAEQRDIAPTLIVLAGVASPGHNTGKVLESALDLSLEQLNPGKQRVRKQKQHLAAALPSSRTSFLDRFISGEKPRAFVGALLIVLGVFMILTTPGLLRGTAAWLLYAAGAAGLYWLAFGVLSISSFYVAWKNIAWMLVMHLICGGMIALAAQKLRIINPVYHFVLFSGLASAVFAVVIPWYAWVEMPQGALVFAAIFAQVECLASFLLVFIMLGVTRIPWRFPVRI